MLLTTLEFDLNQLSWTKDIFINAKWYSQLIFLFFMLIVFSAFFKKFRDQMASIFKFIFKRNPYTSYPWPVKRNVIVFYVSDRLSMVSGDAKKFKEMILHKIQYIREEDIYGKQFIIDFSEVIYISSDVRKVIIEIAKNSIDLNVVQLVFILPKAKKTKVKNDMDKFFSELRDMCKKFNKPGSWEIKENIIDIFKKGR